MNLLDLDRLHLDRTTGRASSRDITGQDDRNTLPERGNRQTYTGKTNEE
jgi:hypothetical protein